MNLTKYISDLGCVRAFLVSAEDIESTCPSFYQLLQFSILPILRLLLHETYLEPPMASMFRRLSAPFKDTSDSEPMMPQSRKSSVTDRTLGARDYKLAVEQAEAQARRSSVILDLSGEDLSSSPEMNGQVYGARDYKLAAEHIQARRYSAISDTAPNSSDGTVDNVVKGRIYGARDYKMIGRKMSS